MPICERSKYRPNPFLFWKNCVISLVANSSTSRKSLFAFLNFYPTWVKVILKNPSIRLILDLETSESSNTTPLAKLARSHFYSRRVGGDFTFRQFVGKYGCTFRSNIVLIVCLMRKSAKTSQCALQTRFRLTFPILGNGQELVLLGVSFEEAV